MATAFVLMIAFATVLLRAADEPRSVPLAAEVATLLDARNLVAFAAEDPSGAGRFAAVLHFPGVQMLVVSGTYAAPDLLRQRIQAGQYREVYTDLSTAAAREGRFFVEDFGAPGLRPTREEQRPFDITWRDTTSSIKYDNQWQSQQLTETEYRDRFARDDAEYAQVLEVLMNALDAAAAPAAVP